METPFDLTAFLADRPVFTLGELAAARGERERNAAHNQIKRHVSSGHVKRVARGVYAAVPPGRDAERFNPDPFLVAVAVRPDGVFAYHSALELLGAAHSVWYRVTMHCDERSRPLSVGSIDIDFLATPTALKEHGKQGLGTQTVLRRTRHVVTTGPERTLVECLRKPSQAGGLDEVVESVLGFALFDFDLLQEVLETYDERTLWAAVGWLTERERSVWETPPAFTEECRRRRPRQSQYLLRNHRGGTLLAGWRLIVPSHLTREPEGNASNT